MPDFPTGANRLFTGARPSPRHILAAAMPFRPDPEKAIPATFLALPTRRSYFLNDTYGDCVTAEAAEALNVYSQCYMNSAEILVPDSEVKSWASQHGVLNGADLTQVNEFMQQSGFVVDGKTYNEGPARAVDWTNTAVLQAAIYQGPVDIGVASSQLANCQGVGSVDGWWAVNFRNDSNEDHATQLCGYGTAANLAAEFNRQEPSLNLTVPSHVDPSTPCYAWYTWSTIGIGDQASINAVVGEAWLRTPTFEGFTPTPPPIPPIPPTPTPTPTPVPPSPTPVSGSYQIEEYTVNWTATSGTTPGPATGAYQLGEYIVLWEAQPNPLPVPTPTPVPPTPVPPVPTPTPIPSLLAAIEKLLSDLAANAPISTIVADIMAVFS